MIILRMSFQISLGVIWCMFQIKSLGVERADGTVDEGDDHHGEGACKGRIDG